MKRTDFAAFAIAILLATDALATFPDLPLEDGVFNYSDPLYMGDYFSFGTDLTYTNGQFPNNLEVTTGLNGFSVSSDLIEPIPGFMSGDNVPVNGQNLSDLFPNTPPEGLGDIFADNSISAVGDFQNGFSEFSVHQRKLSNVSQEEGDFIDGFAEAKANVPFQVVSEGEGLVPAKFDVHLDSFFTANFGGGLSEGASIQILNVTDLGNPTLEYEIAGFYFFFEGFLDASFVMGETDLTDNLSFTPSGETTLDPVAAEFGFEMDVMLDPSMTYAVNLLSDASTFVDNGGSATIDSSNTLDVTISLLDPSARLVIPGTTLIPEPSAVCLLFAGSLAACLGRGRR